METNDIARSDYRPRPTNYYPGVILTVFLCYPYISNRLKSFPRTQEHDIVLAALLLLVWAIIFYWNALGRIFPRLRLLIEWTLGLAIIAGFVGLYVLVYRLILRI